MGKQILFLFCMEAIVYGSSFDWPTNERVFEVGDVCEAGSFVGICKEIKYCPVAKNILGTGKRHNLLRCSWENHEEVVCCPKANTRTPDIIEAISGKTSKRKSDQACEKIKRDSKIVYHISNGENAEEKGYPHMAALGYNISNEMSWNCGASLISARFLLTAAHCLSRNVKPDRVRLGVTKLNDANHVDLDILNFKINKAYDPLLSVGDIGLVELAKDVTFSDRIKPACLYTNKNDPREVIITGWGQTSYIATDDRINILQEATLLSVPLTDCNDTIYTRSSGTKTVDSTQICALGNSTDACSGDSGSPMQIKEKNGVFSIVGIVSYGLACGGNVPGVYTRVSNYLDWIEKYVWP